MMLKITILVVIFMYASSIEARYCKTQHAPYHGFMKCSQANRPSSKCTFRCRRGFWLKGSSSATCNGGYWSDSFPECRWRARCRTELQKPSNGRMTCTDWRFKGSVCTFRCNAGYVLTGYRSSTCWGYLWSRSSPICKPQPKRCFSEAGDLTNGFKACTGNSIGDLCAYICAPGFYLVGNKKSYCLKTSEGGRWNNPQPRCLPKKPKCSGPKEAPENGAVSCNNENQVGSRCIFECNFGYRLVGKDSITCIKNLGEKNSRWSSPSPACVRKPVKRLTCPELPQELENGFKGCEGNLLGNRCYHRCYEGFVLVGRKHTMCVKTPGGSKWNAPTPKCVKRASCPEIASLENGDKACSTDNNKNTFVCYFECNQGFHLVGSESTECLENPETLLGYWNKPPPTCIAPEVGSCPELYAPESGTIDCSEGNSINSECHFTCSENFDLIGSALLMCSTNPNGGDSSWSFLVPECIPSTGCELARKTDFVIVLDTSTIYGQKNLKVAKDFVRSFIDSFDMSEDDTRFSVVQYSGSVQQGSQILLGHYPASKQSLLAAFDRLSSHLGNGLATGKALRHVKNVVLREGNGDRSNIKNIVILFTGGKSEDGVTFPAQQLREETGDTTVYVVGLVPEKGRVDTEGMGSIADAGKFLFAEEEDFLGVEEALSNDLGNFVCRD